jgi:hypothetical protein
LHRAPFEVDRVVCGRIAAAANEFCGVHRRRTCRFERCLHAP